jgi:hypothetical protein
MNTLCDLDSASVFDVATMRTPDSTFLGLESAQSVMNRACYEPPPQTYTPSLL